MRIFIAIELPEEVKRGIAAVQEELKRSGASASWTRPEGIHLTLQFLGEVPDARVQEITAALAAAAEGTGALRLSVAGGGAFPNAKVPRVLWLGVTGDRERLAGLQAKVEGAMERLGFGREERKFSPHLTLARIKFPKPRDNWQQLISSIKDRQFGTFEAQQVSLMKSELRREGAVYTAIGRAELK